MKDENKSNIDSNNIIIVDADYLEEVTGILKDGFEKSLGRTFPKTDLAQWTDCAALDGGLMPGDNKTAVILFHDKNKKEIHGYVPSNYDSELNNQAFRDNLGEFVYTSIPVEKQALKGEMLAETILVMRAEKTVKSITVVADMERYSNDIEKALTDDKDKNKEEKEFSAITMHMKKEWARKQTVLGFSIMHTLGITDEDLKKM